MLLSLKPILITAVNAITVASVCKGKMTSAEGHYLINIYLLLLIVPLKKKKTLIEKILR